MKFLIRIVFAAVFFMPVYLFSQEDQFPAQEGGRGFINTFTAETFGRGFIGANFSGIYNTTNLSGVSGTEELVIGTSTLTFDMSDELELSGVLYTIGRGVLHKEDNRMDHLQSGFGSARLGLKYKVPLNTDNFDMAGRLAFHVPMGADFAIHPSYPYDNEEYGIEAMLIQTYRFSPSWKLHFNEAYRWQGLRDDIVDDDLLITSTALEYRIAPGWTGFSELYSAIEMDDKVEPFQDRLIFTQGVQYVTASNFGIRLGINLRLSEKRKDATPTRAEDWRILLGISFGTRTYLADDDFDGIPNSRDLDSQTPKGWPVDSRGRSLDSDLDGVPDGIDMEPQTPKGALVDRLGKAIDSDGDGVPDGIDQEPNSPNGAIVNVRGVAIDSDGDGIPDGIDLEPRTAAGAKVDSKGRALPPMELELLTKGLLRVHKIYFDPGKATIKPESYEVLHEISRILVKHPELKIEIRGHTDADGTDEFNMQLSIERAKVVREYLLSRALEIIPANLSVQGFGRTMPLSDNRTADGKTLNRRVEFLVLNMDELQK